MISSPNVAFQFTEPLLLRIDLQRRIFGESLAALSTKFQFFSGLRRFWNWLEENYQDPDANLQSAAEFSGLTRTELELLLGGMAGMSFEDLLIRYRILRVTEMMEEQGATRNQLARDNGFRAVRTLDQRFRQVLGFSIEHAKKNGLYC